MQDTPTLSHSGESRAVAWAQVHLDPEIHFPAAFYCREAQVDGTGWVRAELEAALARGEAFSIVVLP